MQAAERESLIDSVLRLFLIGLLGWWVFSILRPFISIIIWGGILAVCMNPLHRLLLPRFGGRRGLCATVMVLCFLLVLVVPFSFLAMAAVDNAKDLGAAVKSGSVDILAPPETLNKIPVVGSRVYGLWAEADADFAAFRTTHEAEIKSALRRVTWAAGSAGGALIHLILSLGVAGAFVTYAREGVGGIDRLLLRIAGPGGPKISALAAATIMSVAKGVVGVAIVQAALLGVGVFVMGVPYAGLITLGAILVALLQLPLLVVAAPLVLYEFNVAETVPATLFAIWAVLASLSDNVLKPMLLGRGVAVPMLVILGGSIGGMFAAGFVGLFEGAVVLSVAYTLFVEWLAQGEGSAVADKPDAIPADGNT